MALPTLSCPQCGADLEYQVTIEMLAPPVGKIDTGYCAACARLFERIRETGTFYDSTLWPPLCRVCRQPVAFARVGAGEEEGVVYECREHPREQWAWIPTADRWIRSSAP
jgi:hypothetical protein